MPKKAVTTMSLEECRRAATTADSWNDLRSKLKGKGCPAATMSQAWSEIKSNKTKPASQRSASKQIVIVLVGPEGGTRGSALKMPGAAKRAPKKVRITISPRSSGRGAPRAPIQKRRGCVQQTTAKYTSRKSPAFPANECCNDVKQGQNEHADRLYRSVADKNGVCKWMLQ